jgi:small subunit ribosomal protein S6
VRTYETVFILDPDLTEDDTETATKRIQTVIEGQKGTVVLLDRWGKRKLAYRVKKKVKGNYVRIVYYGQPASVAVLERNLRIMEEVLKFLTINLAATEIDIIAEEAKQEEERESAVRSEYKDDVVATPQPAPAKKDSEEDAKEAAPDNEQVEAPAEPEE